MYFSHVFILFKINTSRSNWFSCKMLVLYKSLLKMSCLPRLCWAEDKIFFPLCEFPLLQIGPGRASPTAICSGPCAARRQRWLPSRWHRTGEPALCRPSSEAPNENCRSGHWTRCLWGSIFFKGKRFWRKQWARPVLQGVTGEACLPVKSERCRKAKKATCELDFLKPQQSWAVGPGRRGTGSLSTSMWNHLDFFLLLKGFHQSQLC